MSRRGWVCVGLIALGCTHVQSRVPLDRERYPVNCDDADPLTPDDFLVGDRCVGILDADGDGVPNHGTGPVCRHEGEPEGCIDNCRFAWNPEQQDSDGDGVGDACQRVARWDHVTTDVRVVALTFDDGYSDVALKAILDALDAYHARGTFFLNGLYVPDGTLSPQTLKRLAARGHLVGNHSYGHDLGASLEETRQAVAESQRVFLEQAGIDSRPVFRAPAYTRTEWMDDVLLELGYTENLEATLDPHDWANPPPPARAMAMCVAAETLPGDILLFHVGPANTAEALSEILRSLSARGYRFVTVEELLQFGEPALAGMSRQCGKYYGRLEVVP